IRGGGNEGCPGDRFRAAAPAPATVHYGKGVSTALPSFSRSLEHSLHRALSYANERHHEYATLEHLLLALLDDKDAAAVMRACSVELDALRKTIVDYLDNELSNLRLPSGEDAKPTAGFQRVIQRAVIHVQSSGREEVTGAN